MEQLGGISLENISKAFEDTVAIDNVSLDIPEGSFTVLLGPSGCGKSTLLRLISGLETPTSGTIRINNQSVEHQPASARNLSMVFQSYALFPHLTVADNILFGLQVRKVAKTEQTDSLNKVAGHDGPVPIVGSPTCAIVRWAATACGLGTCSDRRTQDMPDG